MCIALGFIAGRVSKKPPDTDASAFKLGNNAEIPSEGDSSKAFSSQSRRTTPPQSAVGFKNREGRAPVEVPWELGIRMGLRAIDPINLELDPRIAKYYNISEETKIRIDDAIFGLFQDLRRLESEKWERRAGEDGNETLYIAPYSGGMERAKTFESYIADLAGGELIGEPLARLILADSRLGSLGVFLEELSIVEFQENGKVEHMVERKVFDRDGQVFSANSVRLSASEKLRDAYESVLPSE